MSILKNRYLHILLAYTIYSFIGVMAKLAATSENAFYFFMFIGIEIMLLGLYALIWQQILKKFSLTVAMSCKGIVVVFSLIWAIAFFRETIYINHIIGSAIIVIGIVIVSGGKEDEND